MSTALRLAEEAKAIFEAADEANRVLSSDERRYVEDLLERAKQHGEAERKIKAIGEQLGSPSSVFPAGSDVSTGGLTPGERFVSSQGYKSISGGNRAERWSTGMVDVGPSQVALGAKGTLLEGGGAPGSGTGGGWLAAPQVVPGMVIRLFQPLTFESLLLSGVATTNTVRLALGRRAGSHGRRRPDRDDRAARSPDVA
jgi:hypothetical protein